MQARTCGRLEYVYINITRGKHKNKNKKEREREKETEKKRLCGGLRRRGESWASLYSNGGELRKKGEF